MALLDPLDHDVWLATGDTLEDGEVAGSRFAVARGSWQEDNWIQLYRAKPSLTGVPIPTCTFSEPLRAARRQSPDVTTAVTLRR